MKLPFCLALLFLAAYAAVHLAPTESPDVVVPIEFHAPPLEVPPDFELEPATNCDTYRIDHWAQEKAVERCPEKI